MSKPWTPAKPTVELKPSRIRRDPVRLDAAAQRPRTAVLTREQELWGGIVGILLFTAVLAVVIVGISIATIFHDDPAADARAAQFDQCYSGGANCVVDGETIYVAGQKLEIAGIAAPRIQDAACAEERSRGIAAAVGLANRLNRGPVTLSAPLRDAYGREVRKVEVKGEDIGQWMINASLAREYTGEPPNWCAGAS